jgi:polar amino acid transport system ATP-binding protein
MSLFEIKNVSKSFGDLKVLNDITVSVDKGEVVAIIGPSGSGKSTLLRCATMLETMDSGELTYHGEKAASNDADGKSVYAPASALRKIKSHYGLVFQQFNLFPHYDVLKNLCDAPIHVQKRNKTEVTKEAMSLIKKMGLEGKEHYYPQQLYGGQQQRVAIA